MFLELITQQKNLCHWGNNTPTPLGRTNVYRAFNEATRLGYNKKQLQNEYNELKKGCISIGATDRSILGLVVTRILER